MICICTSIILLIVLYNNTYKSVEVVNLETDRIKDIEIELLKNKIEILESQLNKEQTVCGDTEVYESEIESKEVELCASGLSKKTYMDYRMITNKQSAQYQLINSSDIYVGDDGLLYTHDGFIGVALGSEYPNIGSKWIIHLSSGRSVNVIKLDEKSDQHTVNGCYHPSETGGCMLEMVIDTQLAKQSYPAAIRDGNFNSADFLEGDIVRIEKVLDDALN